MQVLFPHGVKEMKTGNRHTFDWKTHRHTATLCAVALLSFGLNFCLISQVGYGNAYYAAAIRSMTQSFHNFFYISFDPAGVVSIDKSPLGLWVQALFVLVLGYHGWVMLLPQALAGAASTVLMYLLTAKHFSRPAGLLSALVFALTPAAVVASRNNTMDMQLVFALLLAVWFLFRSIETGKRRFLFAAAVTIGIGFNIKMLQAYMILPAVVLLYLFCSKERPGRRFVSGILATAVMAAVSLAWVAAVDLTPVSDRPYVGSSTNNTVSELIVGHNGMERLVGQGGVSGGMRRGNMGGFQGDGRSRGDGGRSGGQNPPTGQNNGQNMPFGQGNGQGNSQNGGFPGAGNRQGGFGGNRTGGAVGNDIGTAGPLRLWQSSMYGQASWLLIPALFCALACIRKFSLKRMSLRQGIFAFWGVWLVTLGAFFSFASFYHRYYLCMLAPGIAGVVGIGFPEMLRAFRDRRGVKQWLLPLCLVSSTAFSAAYVWSYSQLRTWLFPVIAGSGAAAFVLMTLRLLRPRKQTAVRAVAACMLVSLLAGPFYWSLTAMLYVPENITMPYAGPELASTAKTPGMTANQEAFTTNDDATQTLENYLVKNYKQGSYLVVAQKANDVAQFIVDTGLPAVAYGGFLGSDQALTLDRFKELVKEGKITYFLVSEQSSGMARGSDSEILSYVEENAAKVSPSEYGGSSSVSATLYRFGS